MSDRNALAELAGRIGMTVLRACGSDAAVLNQAYEAISEVAKVTSTESGDPDMEESKQAVTSCRRIAEGKMPYVEFGCNRIPKASDNGVFIAFNGDWYKATAVSLKKYESCDNFIKISGCAEVRSDMSAVLYMEKLCTEDLEHKKTGWMIRRTFASGTDPILYSPPPDETLYGTKEAAVLACVDLIGDDMGADSGMYDPDMWDGLSWCEHADRIRDSLMAVGSYSYADLKWEVKEVTDE